MLKTGIESSAYFGVNDFEQGLKKMKSHGYDCIDYGGIASPDSPFFSYTDEAFENYFRELGQCAQESGIEVFQMHGLWPRFGDGKEQGDERDIELYKKELWVAKLLRCKRFVIHPDMPYGWTDEVRSEAAFERTLRTIDAILPYAKEANTVVCVENMPFREGHSFSTVAELKKLVRTVNDNHVRACFDTGHCNVTGEPFYESIVTLGSDLVALHVHDDKRRRDMHIIPFQGEVDWTGFVKGLKEIGFDGCLSLETRIERTTPEPALETLQIGLAQIAKWFAEQIGQ